MEEKSCVWPSFSRGWPGRLFELSLIVRDGKHGFPGQQERSNKSWLSDISPSISSLAMIMIMRQLQSFHSKRRTVTSVRKRQWIVCTWVCVSWMWDSVPVRVSKYEKVMGHKRCSCMLQKSAGSSAEKDTRLPCFQVSHPYCGFWPTCATITWQLSTGHGEAIYCNRRNIL